MIKAAGTRLGVYEIVAVIGAGGMGEVYRARDTKLGRDVALKILPELFASDAERRARFEREARTLASLNHPHIAQIYGFEQSGDTYALAMELVDGEDLSRRIARGAVPFDEALAIARQIGTALKAAHDQGIVHRDVKPANIKMRSDGTVKVLDFGLAKGADDAGGSGAADSQGILADSPTMTSPAMTKHGVILGTAAYMSPEQARGRVIDTRADIWAFGCVLYELLTGRVAFGAETTTDVLAAVVTREPDWSLLPPETTPSIRRLLRRCLVKDSRQRLQDIGDARLELDEAHLADATALPAIVKRPSLARQLAWLGAGATLASMAFVIALWRAPRSPVVTPGVQLQRLTDAVGNEESPALSPDGKTIAWVATAGGRPHIWVRLLGGGTVIQLTRDDADHQEPRWTADSAAIVYFTPGATPSDAGTLWEIPALGGTARPLLASSSGGDLSRDGTRLTTFQFADGQTALVVASRDGSNSHRIGLLPAGSLYTHPRWSPDGRSIAYQQSDNAEFDKRLWIVSSAGGEPRRVARADDMKGLAWLADGSGVIYSSSQGSTVLYPPTFNLRVVRVDGTDDRPVTFDDASYIEPDVQTSSIVMASRVKNQSDVWRIPVGGSPADNVRQAARVTHQTGVAQVPSVSPDEKEVVYLSDSGGHGNLWVTSVDGSSGRQLTFERDPNVSIGVPVWSPTAKTIAFIVTRSGIAHQWLVNPDGSGMRSLVGGFWAYWSPDGRWLYYAVLRDARFAIDKLPLDGGAPVTVRRDDAVAPAIASDGTLYFATAGRRASGWWDWTLMKALPESGEAVPLTLVRGGRVPQDFINIHPILSPDEKWLVQPLVDGATSNLWLVNVQDGSMRQVTDFSDRPVLIARRTSWSRDSKYVYAAIAETDADVVAFRNLLQQ